MIKDNLDSGLDFAPDFARAAEFFKGHADYAETPLRSLKTDSGANILAKDETQRMGLGAFKALGAPYAMFRLLGEEWEARTGEVLTYSDLSNAAFREFASEYVFVCATAGNHGLGVAAGAQLVGARARIYLAASVPRSFGERLSRLGAEVIWSGDVYAESNAAAIADSEAHGSVLLADGSWAGYTTIPKLVMEGYCVIAEELREHFESSGGWPGRVYLQAGVGGIAAAMAHMIRLNWVEQPELVVVEPEEAPCLGASHVAGSPVRVEGVESVMGRLDCKEVSVVAFEALERCNVRYVALSEAEGIEASRAVTALGIGTTPSGAAGYGAWIKDEKAGVASSGVPLILVTEGR